MSIFSNIFRPISDLFRPLLKCPETKGFTTFRAKFSDLKMVGRNSRFFLQNALSFCIFAVRDLAAYNRRLTVRKRQVVSSKPIAESPGSQHTSPSPLQEESQYKSKIKTIKNRLINNYANQKQSTTPPLMPLRAPNRHK